MGVFKIYDVQKLFKVLVFYQVLKQAEPFNYNIFSSDLIKKDGEKIF